MMRWNSSSCFLMAELVYYRDLMSSELSGIR